MLIVSFNYYHNFIKYRMLTNTFQMCEKFKHLGTTVTNQNEIHKEIKITLNLGYACYHSVQNLSSSHIIS